MPTPLSARLAQAVPVDFFRPLTRPSAPVYVDCADRLIDEAGEAGRLSHKETLEILREVLAAHPGSLLAEDEGSALRDARLKLILATRQVLRNGLNLIGVSAPETM